MRKRAPAKGSQPTGDQASGRQSSSGISISIPAMALRRIRHIGLKFNGCIESDLHQVFQLQFERRTLAVFGFVGPVSHQIVDETVRCFGGNQSILEAVAQRIERVVLCRSQTILKQEFVDRGGKYARLVSISGEAARV